MESQIKSSFIPKDAPEGGYLKAQRSSGALDLLLLAAIILVFASLALGVGIFLYQQYLQSSLNSKRDQLERARDAFEPALIEELTRLDKRMNAAQGILNNHIAPSEVFALLEQLTLQTVGFESLSFEAADANTMTISMSGTAVSVNSIALQADLFGKHPAIASPIFSNIRREAGGVRFDVDAVLNPAVLRFGSVVQTRGALRDFTPQQPATPFAPPPEVEGGEQEQETIPLFES